MHKTLKLDHCPIRTPQEYEIYRFETILYIKFKTTLFFYGKPH